MGLEKEKDIKCLHSEVERFEEAWNQLIMDISKVLKLDIFADWLFRRF